MNECHDTATRFKRIDKSDAAHRVFIDFVFFHDNVKCLIKLNWKFVLCARKSENDEKKGFLVKHHSEDGSINVVENRAQVCKIA